MMLILMHGFGESKYWFAASRIFVSKWVLRVEQLEWHNYELIKIEFLKINFCQISSIS